MSFANSASKAIESIIHEYIQQISNKYDLNPEELLALWEGKSSKSKSNTLPPPPPSTSSPDTGGGPPTDKNISNGDLTEDNLKKETVATLKQMCKTKGLKTSGNKGELITLLLAGPVEKPPPKTSKNPTPPPIIKKISSAMACTPLRRNQFMNYEHPESGLVFDSKTKKVIGKQNPDGQINNLTPEDIELCKKFKFEYTLPENLDANTKLEDEQVEELDDEIIDSEDELSEEELIEDEESEIEDFDDYPDEP